jgi:hypothetical protein
MMELNGKIPWATEEHVIATMVAWGDVIRISVVPRDNFQDPVLTITWVNAGDVWYIGEDGAMAVVGYIARDLMYFSDNGVHMSSTLEMGDVASVGLNGDRRTVILELTLKGGIGEGKEVDKVWMKLFTPEEMSEFVSLLLFSIRMYKSRIWEVCRNGRRNDIRD